ncbi:nitroreductase family protein [Candidatus Woesearchaeota archaeon]|nr:nitroreductase family protein [Candidatus Woesearchaeota archaeon]MBI2130513.1 nitroreductase family protein [Candidatus Woesearchaeota archaeon]
MDVLDCIRTRRSVRKYKEDPVPWDNIVTIMQAGKYAPAAGNIFNTKFLVVKSDAKRKMIAEACVQQYWMEIAPIHIVMVAEPEHMERYYGTRGARLYTIQGAAAAAENMLLTAHSLGLGACWVGAFDEEEIRRILNLPEHVNVQAVITIGYPDERPEPPVKQRIEHIVYFERWWGRMEAPKTGLGYWSPYIKRGLAETKKIAEKKSRKLVDRISQRIRKARKK